MEIDVKVTDNASQTVHDITSRIVPETTKKIQKWVLRISAQAKRNSPVDQGRLRNSITEAVFELQNEILGIVGTNDSKAPFVEYGTGQIGKRTAEAMGVKAPEWYKYGPQEGHFVPFIKAPDLIRWMNKHGFDVVPSGLGRYDISLKGSQTPLFRNAKGFKVSGKAQSFLTPAFLKYAEEINKDFQTLGDEIVKK